jgi:hypothetical protein
LPFTPTYSNLSLEDDMDDKPEEPPDDAPSSDATPTTGTPIDYSQPGWLGRLIWDGLERTRPLAH